MEIDIVAKRSAAETLADLEAMWACFDTIWDGFTDADWSRPYGRDWTFADQPFHMAYFDRVLVNDAIEAGPDLPEVERWTTDTSRELNEWNAREFAQRPADEGPERSRERWRIERDRLRTLLTTYADDQLDTRPVFLHLLGGDGFTLRDAITGSIVHNWGELSELRFRAGRDDVRCPATATHHAVSFYVFFLSLLGRPDRASKPFTLGVSLTGPGGGEWHVRLADGASKAFVGAADKADLTFRMDPDDFNLVMVREAVNPMKAMLTGRLKVKGLARMPTMKKLFPEPGPDERIVALT